MVNIQYSFIKKYKTNNILVNKVQSDADIVISIEPKFNEEMRLFINRVIGTELTFLNNYYNEDALNLLIRVNNNIAAYGRIEFGTMEKNTNNELIMNNSIHVNRICIDESYRGNKFYDTMFLLSIKYAHENNLSSISCMIGTQKEFLHKKVHRYGFNQFYKILNIPIGWTNFKTTGDCIPFKYNVQNYINLNYINHLIDLSILNNNSNYENILNLLKVSSKL